MKLQNLKGQKFGRLTVLSRSQDHISVSGRKIVMWNCKCACGKRVAVRGGNLGTSSNSCGCLRRDQAAKRHRTHGQCRTKVYRAWIDMIRRCTKRHHFAYPKYGGRGIKVCARWKSFRMFLRDMGHPQSGMSLDRRDNNGDYCKRNCRWATRKQQQRNLRRNRMFSIGSKRRCLQEWSEIGGVRAATIIRRMDHLGWSAKRAVFDPVEVQVRNRPVSKENREYRKRLAGSSGIGKNLS